jgi:hypothetical protein
MKNNFQILKITKGIDDIKKIFFIIKNKKEIIVIGAIGSNENFKCSNGELIAVNNKVNVNLLFRQVSQFNYRGGKTTSALNIISSESISRGTFKLKEY